MHYLVMSLTRTPVGDPIRWWDPPNIFLNLAFGANLSLTDC